MNKRLLMTAVGVLSVGGLSADILRLESATGVRTLTTAGWTATLDGRPVSPVAGTFEGAPDGVTAWTFPDVDFLTSHQAVMTTVFTVPEDGVLSFGATADWFFDVSLDDRTVYSTGADGNGSSEFGLWNHTVKEQIKQGEHRLTVTLRNGMAGMMFAMGEVQTRPVAECRPVTKEELQTAFRTLWTTDCRSRHDERRMAAIEVIERAIAMTDGESFRRFVQTGSADFVRAPALAMINASVDRVLTDVPQTVVPDGTVAIWYLYNMGLVVKTPETTFGIDISMPRDEELADLLDFLLVTHNHPDHVSERLVAAMQKKGGFLNGKPVVSSFLYTRQFARTPQTFTLGDCRVETGITDHNPFWKESVTPFRITCGRGPNAPVLVHAGDGWDGRQLASFAPADIVFCHVKPFKGHNAAETSAVLKPKLTVILHAQEMSHGFGPQRASYALCASEAALVSISGCQAAWPIWGEKILWPSAADLADK